jgi:hypothetical protein
MNAKFRCKNKPMWRTKSRGKDNTEMDLGEIGFE